MAPSARRALGAREVSTNPAETRNDAASTASPHPAPTPAVITPDIAAPARLAEFCDRRISCVRGLQLRAVYDLRDQTA